MTGAGGLSVSHYLCPPGYGAERFMAEAAEAGMSGIGMTVAALDELGAQGCGAAARRNGLTITTLNSCGNFLYRDQTARRGQRHANRRLIEAAAQMDARVLVVVTGGLSGQAFSDDTTLRALPIWNADDARARVEEELGLLLDEARGFGVRLALEPIHPMDILFKGVVTSIAEARALLSRLPGLEIILDLYHSWWDRDLISPPASACGVQICGLAQGGRDDKPDRDVLGAGIFPAGPVIAALAARNPHMFFEFEMFDRHRRGREVVAIMREAATAWRAIGRTGNGA